MCQFLVKIRKIQEKGCRFKWSCCWFTAYHKTQSSAVNLSSHPKKVSKQKAYCSYITSLKMQCNKIWVFFRIFWALLTKHVIFSLNWGPSILRYQDPILPGEFFKGIVKWAEPCKCVILLVLRILYHKRINPSLKERRFWYLMLTGNFPP